MTRSDTAPEETDRKVVLFLATTISLILLFLASMLMFIITSTHETEYFLVALASAMLILMAPGIPDS